MFTWVDMDDAASGYNEQISFNATEIDSYTLISDSSQVQVTEATSDNGQRLVSFRSSQLGIGKDNPATFDDLYTPGSYWVNPPSPRTVDGRHADPWTGEVVEYDMSGAVVSSVEAEDESVDDGELSAAERAILADIEGL